MTTIDRFAAALKERLRANRPEDIVDVAIGAGSTRTGGYIDSVEVDWPELERQIDELAAEFAKQKS